MTGDKRTTEESAGNHLAAGVGPLSCRCSSLQTGRSMLPSTAGEGQQCRWYAFAYVTHLWNAMLPSTRPSDAAALQLAASPAISCWQCSHLLGDPMRNPLTLPCRPGAGRHAQHRVFRLPCTLAP